MNCMESLSGCTDFSDTASVTEVFIPVVGALLWVICLLMLWWYRRKGESPYRDGASKTQIAFFWAVPVFLGVVSLVFAVFAFIPGGL
jgi:hypothetical protein